jgi:catechol 2,3-dioxygenase-like lactoylglutathione lyase family enzyme
LGSRRCVDLPRPPPQNSNFPQEFERSHGAICTQARADPEPTPARPSFAVENTTMINHVSLGVSDIDRAKAFYDTALKPLGYSCLSSAETSLGYGRDAVALWLSLTQSPVPPDPASGLHICFDAATRKAVNAFHKAALASGGRDNGKPGVRTEYGDQYYAAFVIDPDGYRIEAYCGQPG